MNVNKFKTIYLSVLIPITVIVCIVSLGYRVYTFSREVGEYVSESNWGGVVKEFFADLGSSVNSNVKIGVNGGSWGDPVMEEYDNLEFTNMDIDLAFANIKIKEGDAFKVTTEYSAELLPEVKVVGDTLTVKHDSKNYSIQINGKSMKCDVTIIVPKGTVLGEVTINTDLGNVEIKDELHFSNIDITASLGNIEIDSATAEKLEIEAKLGNVEIKDGDITTINIQADLGDVTLRDTRFDTGVINDDLGEIDVKGEFGSLTAGCDLGDVKVDCDNLSSAKMDLDTDLGSVKVNGKKHGSSYKQ